MPKMHQNTTFSLKKSTIFWGEGCVPSPNAFLMGRGRRSPYRTFQVSPSTTTLWGVKTHQNFFPYNLKKSDPI